MNNSRRETKSSNTTLESIEEIATFRPHEADFKDPILYIEKLLRKSNIARFGCIKIIPPESFKPPLAFDMESDQKLPTRYQVLQELS